ncbi:NADPH-dependent FMN reductase [Thermoactinospora rubra]|uniref:NADPH-dependent FMN reductase n=1 Tax=Thermoactinospora rubra TaxID=1088767 RepID=UPI000A11DD56|nr:NAD(P)H-dependent oxidoreductase [Thermoactinospora rubra]
MSTEPLRVAVIVGSTREGRVGDTVARWFADHASGRPELEVTVVDLADYAFPARYPRCPDPVMREFAAAVGRADAFVVVTPEYNRSFPASLKQAIDCAYDEWRAKPVGFVSYGSGSDGVFAVEQLRTVFTELHAMTVRDGVGIDLMTCTRARDEHLRAAEAMLDQLTWWALALREARAARPYVS